MITGATQLVAILGSPIAQVRSPDNFNRWFQAHGLDVAMLPIDLDEAALAAFVAGLRGWNNLRGCVVTVPYKQAVVPLLDRLSPRARLLRAVNVIRREDDGQLWGDNVDGEGFIRAAAAHTFEPAGKRALVLGAGGAGAAISHALADNGLAELSLRDPEPARAQALAQLLTETFPRLKVDHALGEVAGYHLLANASPVGMGPAGTLPLPAEYLAGLGAATLVADVVTKPVETPLLQLARRAGCRVQTGPEMAAAQMGSLGHFMGVMPLDATF